MTPSQERPRGRIFTFYSYKGGVGRSMALANVAVLLSQRGNRVLVVDWDLEAPGIERYFEDMVPGVSREVRARNGIIEIAAEISGKGEGRWKDSIIKVPVPQGAHGLDFLSAGMQDGGYVARLQQLDWESLFQHHDFGNRLEAIRNEWLEEYDYILIDSRTGITDIGGICTIYLPDVLVALFTANNQSVEGIADVIARARRARSTLPVDRAALVCVPVPARDESRTEYQQSVEWRKIYHERLSELYVDFLPKNVSAADALDLLRIPNVPFWSFGERLPVLKESPADPNGITYYYTILARLLATDLSWQDSATSPETDPPWQDSATSPDGRPPGPVAEAPRAAEVMVPPILEYGWERQSVWSRTADQLKAAPQLQWRLRLILTVAAAALALAGTQVMRVSAVASYTLAAVAAAALAGVGLLRGQQDAEQTRRWTRARSVAEAMKAEVYTFLAQSSAYQPSSREADLEAEIHRLERDANDLLPYTQGVAPTIRPLPPVRDVETYLEVRVLRSQLEGYYEPKAVTLRKQLRWAKVAEVMLTLVAAVFAAFAAISPSVGAWAAVVTTAVGAVTAYAASERYDFLWIEYSRTASELRRLYSRRTAPDGRPLSGTDLVNECEQVIALQNQVWLAKWGEKSSGKGLSQAPSS